MFLKLLKKLFKPAPPKLGKGLNSYYAIHAMWGDRIEFSFDDEGADIRRIDGHRDYYPIVGGILRSRGDGKRIILWEIIEIKGCGDPIDMFYGYVRRLGFSSDSYTLDTE